ADLDEYALIHQAARWTRGEDVAPDPRPGDGRVKPAIADAWRAILLRRPRWRSEAEGRLEYESGAPPAQAIASLGAAPPGPPPPPWAPGPAPVPAREPLLGVGPRPGSPLSLERALGRLPAWATIARRYRRQPDRS